VEVLDKYFGSVCELDIIFNFEKAYFILDELILGGEMQVKKIFFASICFNLYFCRTGIFKDKFY
jgi:Clathrin adaptor complex small chain